MSKLIPLEEVEKILKRYIALQEWDSFRTLLKKINKKINSLPTIDPISEIEKMEKYNF
jgi:hypothetical protein